MMKRKSLRTTSIGLMLLGSAGLLASCGDDPEVQSGLFESVAACAASGTYTAEECKTGFDQAKAATNAEAPKFGQKAQCEAQFGTGNCETTIGSDGTSMFMPLMAGFMIGNMMNSGGSRHYYHQPVYKDKNKGYVNSGGAFISRSAGAVRVPSSSYRAPSGSGYSSSGYKGGSSVTSTSSRGGFGSRAGGVSS